MARYGFHILNSIQFSNFVPFNLRRKLVQFMGIDCGERVCIYSRILFGSEKVRLGEGCFVNTDCFFDGSDWVEIGGKTHIGPRVQFHTSTHRVGPRVRRAGNRRTAPIKVGSGCWVGAGAIILPGVKISDGCLIGAGAVVRKHTRPNGLYVGIPAKRVRDLDSSDLIIQP